MIVDKVTGQVRFAYNTDRNRIPKDAMKVEMYLDSNGIFYVVPHEDEIKKDLVNSFQRVADAFGNMGISVNDAINAFNTFNTYGQLGGNAQYEIRGGLGNSIRVELESQEGFSKIEFD